MTLADKVTLSRLVLAPLAVCGYLLLPADHGRACFWVAGWLCAAAEWSDLLDGRIARKRGEVSDFGKLADPFCDVIYRLSIFLAMLLPAGGSGWPAEPLHLDWHAERWNQFAAAAPSPGQLVFALHDGRLGIGLMPWLPVFLMVLRELVAGGLRALSASAGVVLAARASGKFKAWVQGVVILASLAFPAFFGMQHWILSVAYWGAWLCAVISIASILEYIWVNREILARLLERKPAGSA
jgi:phosphatidylglycerophosphate synthase